MRSIILVLALLLCGAAHYPHTVLTGTVTRVVDGDTIVVELSSVYLGQTNVNAEMVSRGDAWVYRHYIKGPDRQWCAFEAEARDKRRGLWKSRNAIPPWTFRHHTNEYSIPPCP